MGVLVGLAYLAQAAQAAQAVMHIKLSTHHHHHPQHHTARVGAEQEEKGPPLMDLPQDLLEQQVLQVL